jgi:hypothetical protein
LSGRSKGICFDRRRECYDNHKKTWGRGQAFYGRLPATGGEVVKSSTLLTRIGIAAMALIFALAGGMAAAMACSCPKEQLIKKYGTVSQVRPPVPLPPPLPTSKSPAPVAGG